MTFRLANLAGRAVLVDDADGLHDVAELSGGELGPDPMDVIADTDRLHELAGRLDPTAATARLDEVALHAPVPRPRSVFGIGLNYRDHVAETGKELPTVPVVFGKFSSCIAGPGAEIELRGDSVDYEAEMVVVIGRGGRDISAADAWDHIAGVTGGQDVSDRALQFAATPPHFDLAKSGDGYGPIGPIVVSPDRLTDRDAIGVACDVNGQRRQESSTAELIFDVPTLIEYLSAIVSLRPGDLIFTGTPAGVGVPTGDFLRPGDVVVTTIEGVGSMTTTCR